MKLKRRSPSNSTLVVFTAVKETTQDGLGLNQNILFDKVVLNEGNGFHPIHGVFIVSRRGVYLFTISLVPSSPTEFFHGALVVNGDIIVRLHGLAPTWDQTTQTVFLSLAPGDEVFVRNLDYEHRIVVGGLFSSFSGCLMWEL